MTDDLKERLRINLYYSWGDESDVGEQALSYITDLEARLAAAEAEVKRLTAENEIRWQLEKKWQDRAVVAEAERGYWQKDSAAAWDKCEERRLQAVAAEAGEDALAEALDDMIDEYGANIDSECRLKGYPELAMIDRCHAALAAYDARRKE